MSELKSPLPAVVDELWERRGELSPDDSAARAEIVAAVDQIDAGVARVPIVPGAILFDLGIGNAHVRPTREMGEKAAQAAGASVASGSKQASGA